MPESAGLLGLGIGTIMASLQMLEMFSAKGCKSG